MTMYRVSVVKTIVYHEFIIEADNPKAAYYAAMDRADNMNKADIDTEDIELETMRESESGQYWVRDQLGDFVKHERGKPQG